MRVPIAFLAACIVAALVPWLYSGPSRDHLVRGFPGWPSDFEGRPLKPVQLTKAEERFQSVFPGRIAKFTDGKRVIVMRWVVQETRKLHPASDCYRGSGYEVSPLPIRIDNHGNLWGAKQARRGNETLRISERIFDGAGLGWTDVSAWYWAAFLGNTHGPWWAVTVVEKRAPDS